MKTIKVQADIPASRELRVTLPYDAPVGRRTILVTFDTPDEPLPAPRTRGDLLDSEFFGMWAERDDLGDSVEFARNLRETVWRRGAGLFWWTATS